MDVRLLINLSCDTLKWTSLRSRPLSKVNQLAAIHSLIHNPVQALGLIITDLQGEGIGLLLSIFYQWVTGELTVARMDLLLWDVYGGRMSVI